MRFFFGAFFYLYAISFQGAGADSNPDRYPQEVRIIDEASFPIECMANDPTAKVIIEHLEIPPEKVKEVASSVISIKVYGVKPS